MRRADNLSTFMCRLSINLGASVSWNPQGLSRPVQGLLYRYLLPQGQCSLQCENEVNTVNGTNRHRDTQIHFVDRKADGTYSYHWPYPAEAIGFFGRKNPQHAFFRRGSKRICPMSQLCGMSKNLVIYVNYGLLAKFQV